MNLFKKKKTENNASTFFNSSREANNPFSILDNYSPLSTPEIKLYESIREGVPVIDSAINKIVRLVGGFKLVCEDKNVEILLNDFCDKVNVSGVNTGLENFIATYFDSMLTYGNAVGEIIIGENNEFLGLYNASLDNIEVKKISPLDVDFYVRNNSMQAEKVENKNLVLFSTLNPKAGEPTGVSILRSLPFVTGILFKIYNSIGQNFDRIGNIRYAVTYKPSNDMVDKAYAKDRANLIAKEWSEGMRACANGQVRDFITVGDVDIKVIGADNQMIDTNVPIRQMLEQIIAKLSIPPFLLGLSWSTTERMSKQQTDILTTELLFYRRLLAPVILKICRTFLRLNNIYIEPKIEWSVINLKDEVEQAQAKLYNAQALQIEETLKGEI